MPEIIPAIMPKTFDDLQYAVEDIVGVTAFVQIDIMDGNFVTGKTWPYGDEEFFQTFVTEENTLPEWQSIQYELDMMVSDPMSAVHDWVSCGIARVIMHTDAIVDLEKTVNEFNKLYRIVDNPAGVELVIAVPFDGSADIIEKVKNDIDGVQVMGISPVGVQGSSFKDGTVDTVKAFSEAYSTLPISVDGGVKKEHIVELTKAGATRLVMGSAIFDSDNPRAEIKLLRDSV